MVGTFIAVFLGVSGVVYLNYPDLVAYPREFENGLERELGGPGAVRVSSTRPFLGNINVDDTNYHDYRHEWLAMLSHKIKCQVVYNKE